MRRIETTSRWMTYLDESRRNRPSRPSRARINGRCDSGSLLSSARYSSRLLAGTLRDASRHTGDICTRIGSGTADRSNSRRCIVFPRSTRATEFPRPFTSVPLVPSTRRTHTRAHAHTGNGPRYRVKILVVRVTARSRECTHVARLICRCHASGLHHGGAS